MSTISVDELADGTILPIGGYSILQSPTSFYVYIVPEHIPNAFNSTSIAIERIDYYYDEHRHFQEFPSVKYHSFSSSETANECRLLFQLGSDIPDFDKTDAEHKVKVNGVNGRPDFVLSGYLSDAQNNHHPIRILGLLYDKKENSKYQGVGIYVLDINEDNDEDDEEGDDDENKDPEYFDYAANYEGYYYLFSYFNPLDPIETDAEVKNGKVRFTLHNTYKDVKTLDTYPLNTHVFQTIRVKKLVYGIYQNGTNHRLETYPGGQPEFELGRPSDDTNEKSFYLEVPSSVYVKFRRFSLQIYVDIGNVAFGSRYTPQDKVISKRLDIWTPRVALVYLRTGAEFEVDICNESGYDENTDTVMSNTAVQLYQEKDYLGGTQRGKAIAQCLWNTRQAEQQYEQLKRQKTETEETYNEVARLYMQYATATDYDNSFAEVETYLNNLKTLSLHLKQKCETISQSYTNVVNCHAAAENAVYNYCGETDASDIGDIRDSIIVDTRVAIWEARMAETRAELIYNEISDWPNQANQGDKLADEKLPYFRELETQKQHNAEAYFQSAMTILTSNYERMDTANNTLSSKYFRMLEATLTQDKKTATECYESACAAWAEIQSVIAGIRNSDAAYQSYEPKWRISEADQQAYSEKLKEAEELFNEATAQNQQLKAEYENVKKLPDPDEEEVVDEEEEEENGEGEGESEGDDWGEGAGEDIDEEEQDEKPWWERLNTLMVHRKQSLFKRSNLFYRHLK